MSNERFCERLRFINDSGIDLYPVRIENRPTGQVLFRVSEKGNKLSDGEEVEEEKMLQLVLQQNYMVRMTPKEGGDVSLYRPYGRSIVAVLYQDGKVWKLLPKH